MARSQRAADGSHKKRKHNMAEGPEEGPETGPEEVEVKRKRVSSVGPESEVQNMDLLHVKERGELLDSEILELEEFLPDVRKKTVDVIQKHLRYDLQKIRLLKQRGQRLCWGRYSAEENLQIQKNVENFLSLTGIESPQELFFPQRFPDRYRAIKKLRVLHRFYQRIAEGVNRTCEQVYIRAKKIYDEHHYLGTFSEEELQTLERLHTLHGNDWKTIGHKLDRSASAVQKRYAVLGAKRGAWSSDEELRLQKAVKKHLKHLIRLQSPSRPGPDSDSEVAWVQLCMNLPWTKISLKVGSRSWVQCRLKWFTLLKSRLKGTRRINPGSSLQTRVRLIQTLYELQVEQASDVDWVVAARTVGCVTPVCVQKLFHRMKVSFVPGWSQLSFGEIVDFLFETRLPVLRKRLLDLETEEPGPRPDPFNLDQIFPRDQDQDFTEVDNS